MRLLRIAILMTALATAASTAWAHETAARSESVAPRMQMPIANLPGTTFTSAIVTFPPGSKAVPHRHGEAFVYAYVVSGAVRSQLDDQPAKVYQTGQDWHEAPGAHHKMTENVSKTRPARLLVVFVAPNGTPLKVPD